MAMENGCGKCRGKWVWPWREGVEWEHSCTGDVDVWKGHVVRMAGMRQVLHNCSQQKVVCYFIKQM